MTHLEGCLTRPVNLDELAHLAGMSKRSFARAFHGATGMPPIAYLIQLRINRAAELLRSGTESITEVAFRVGFADSNYFTRQFRKLMGKSPRQHRQALEEL
jgi:transcriptional regulator GlxA family with amidase domain